MVLNRNHKKDNKNISKNVNNHHVNRLILSKWNKRLSDYLSKKSQANMLCARYVPKTKSRMLKLDQ